MTGWGTCTARAGTPNSIPPAFGEDGACVPPVTPASASAGAPALALAGVTGGTQAPSSPKAGGIEFGVPARAVHVPHPVISTLSVPAGATAGAPPKVTLRLDEKGVGTVYLQVTITNLATRRAVVVASMG